MHYALAASMISGHFLIDQVKKNKRNGETKKGKAKTESLHTSQISSAYQTGTVSLRMFASIGQ